MASFATPSDLATKLGNDVDTEQAQQALDEVSDEIRAAAGQYISRVVDDPVVLRVNPRSQQLTLPERPAENPTVITAAGVGVGGWYWDGLEMVSLIPLSGFWWTWAGTDWAGAADIADIPFGFDGMSLRFWGATTVNVTYTHGSDDPRHLALAKAVCLAAAAREFDNPIGARMESVDDYTRQMSDRSESEGALTGGEIKRIRTTYARRIGSSLVSRA